MTVRDLKGTTNTSFRRLVLRGLHYTHKVIEFNSQTTNRIEPYLDMEVDEINPYIESKIDSDGELRAKARIEAIIYEN